MDIGVIIPELRKYGGAEKLLIECLRRWQYKHLITVYAIGFNEKLLEEHKITNIKLKKLTPYFNDRHAMLLNGILLPKIWEKEIGKHDIYHTHLWPMHLIDLHPVVWYPHEPLRVINDLKYEQPVATTAFETSRNVHTYPKTSYDLVDIKCYAAYQKVISIFDKTGTPDKILANSKYTANYLSKVYGQDNIDVVYPGINKEDFFYQEPNENIILNVNQLWPHKRVNLIIEAMQYIEDAQLYIVGKGPEENKLKNQAKALGLSDRVFFMGSVTNEELAILYARALAVVFAPVREPFGIVALESLAAGKALIAVKEGGYCEAVDDKCAFLVNAVPEEIAEKIRFLIDNKNIAKKMGLEGLKKVDEYTWEKTSDGILKAIEETYNKYKNKYVEKKYNKNTLIGVDYFMWYGAGFGASHWNDNKKYGAVNQKPLLGYYSSDSGEIIRKHLSMLENIGVDYIAANIHIDEKGINVYQRNVIERILDIIEEDSLNIKLCLQICPYSTSNDKYITDIKKLLDDFINRKGYLWYGNKPLVFMFWTGSLDGDYNTIEDLKIVFKNCVLIASSLRIYNRLDEELKTFNLFDGWSLFSPLEIASEDNREKLIDDVYLQYEAGKEKIKVYTCSPGYDDRILEDPNRDGNRQRFIDRKQGKLFEKYLSKILNLDPKPNIIKISTFNEYHENTNIEPTLEYKTLYMDILEKYINLIKKDE